MTVMPEDELPRTARATLARVDAAWRQFRSAAGFVPAERMNEHLDEAGWTRKQMLAHVTAWHELTADRLNKLFATGKPSDPPETANPDAFNARVARQAVGRTAGEVLEEMDMSFNRLRRYLERMTDGQLALHDDWAAHVIAGNTYGHYAEHLADVAPPEPPPADVQPATEQG